MPYEVRTCRRPLARHDIDRTGGETDFGRELRDPQRRQRRLRVGLEDDRAACRKRRRQLPGRHHQRVVPRHDLRGDADGLLERVEEQRAADRIRASADGRDRGAVEAEVLDSLVELGLHGGDRLADVAGLELRKLAAVCGDRVCESVQQPRPLRAGRLAPRAVERGPRGRDGTVDVRLARQRGDSKRGAARRLDQLARLAVDRFDRLAADEEADLALGGRTHAPDDTDAASSRS
jgi:ParB family chromosome partitioning protein